METFWRDGVGDNGVGPFFFRLWDTSNCWAQEQWYQLDTETLNGVSFVSNEFDIVAKGSRSSAMAAKTASTATNQWDSTAC
jgi:hypothetical protein